MLYKQRHRNRIHLYWSSTNNIMERISIGKLGEIERIINIFFGNRSRNKKAILQILQVFDRTNLISFLEQDKKTVLAELKAIEED